MRNKIMIPALITLFLILAGCGYSDKITLSNGSVIKDCKIKHVNIDGLQYKDKTGYISYKYYTTIKSFTYKKGEFSVISCDKIVVVKRTKGFFLKKRIKTYIRNY